jgi:hypothetical protein
MTRHTTVLAFIAAMCAACDQDSTTGFPDAVTDAPADGEDVALDTATWDTTPNDTTSSDTTPADTPADTAADTPADPAGDDGGGSDIDKFCTTACEDCFGGDAPWMSRPADECIPECVADFADCSPSDIPSILECTGGDGCPEGPMGFAFCVASYTCLL